MTKSTWLTVNDTLQFQSLFWWILYCDLVGCVGAWLCWIGFNPCFGGSYIVTLVQSIYCNGFILFQSLFWWILYCDKFTRRLLLQKKYVSILVLVDLIL